MQATFIAHLTGIGLTAQQYLDGGERLKANVLASYRPAAAEPAHHQGRSQAQALEQELIDRISSSVLCISNADGEVIATAIVWDYTSTDVLLLTNFHTWDDDEFRYCFPPKEDAPLAKKQKKGETKATAAETKKQKKGKTKADEDETASDPVELNLHNERAFEFNFTLTSDIFHSFSKEEDFAVLKLPKANFTMQRIPISLGISLTLKIHAFGYIGHTKRFNISGGEVSGLIAEGFTMNLLSAGGYYGAAILADSSGRAVGYMGGNLDTSHDKNSQHQSYGFRFDRVILVTKRQMTPTNLSAGKELW